MEKHQQPEPQDMVHGPFVSEWGIDYGAVNNPQTPQAAIPTLRTEADNEVQQVEAIQLRHVTDWNISE